MLGSLKSKMLIPTLGILVLLVVLVVLYVTDATGNLAYNLAQERIRTYSQTTRAYFESLEENNRMAARYVSRSPDLVRLLGSWNAGAGRAEVRGELAGYLNARLGDFSTTTAFVVVDGEGMVVLRTHMDLYGDTASATMLNALAGGLPSAFSMSSAPPIGLVNAVPVYDGENIIGSLGTIVHIADDKFIDNFSKVFNAGVTVFAGGTSAGSSLRTADGNRAVGTQAGAHIQEAVLHRGESFTGMINLFGMPHYVYYFPLPDLAGRPVGMFFVGFSNEYTITATGNIQRNLLIIGIAALAAAFVMMLLYVTRLLRPLDSLAENLRDIASGDADLTKRLPVAGRDEIATASGYFNRTMDGFRNMILAIKGQTDTLSEVSGDLSANMTEAAAAMNEIAANIHSIQGRVVNQSGSVSQTHTTMEEVVGSINRLNAHIESQSENISRASSAIEQMVANTRSVTETLVKNGNNVKTLMRASEVGRGGLQGVADDIQEIARESEGLLEINSVMENIASQTNLLSMNAAIEAAHAGEAGKGFAVVADEIRKLAENSGEQSKIISEVLKKIKGAIDKITGSTESVMRNFEEIDSSVKIVAEQEENIRNAMEEQNHGSREILEGIGNVNELTRQVKDDSHRMLEGAKNVINESTHLGRVTQEITLGTSEMASGAQQVNVAVNHVNEISLRNRQGIDVLAKEVSRFKV